MIKKSKIKELINDKVAPILSDELTKHGFKYQKSKQLFSRQDTKGFFHIINIPHPTHLLFMMIVRINCLSFLKFTEK